MENEINLAIQGYNREKEMLVFKMGFGNSNDETNIKNRLREIDYQIQKLLAPKEH